MVTEQGPDDLLEALEELRGYLNEQPIEFVLLFGSQVSGTATDRSDIDLVVKFPETLADAERFRRRNRIAGEIMARLGREDIDVSDLEDLPTAVAHAALQEGILIVGNEETADRYRQQVAGEYEQTASARRREREALLRRLRKGTYGR